MRERLPHVPPQIAATREQQDYLALSAMCTRFTSVGNCLDRCAVSLPLNVAGGLPVGLTLMGEHGADRELLATALGVEAALRP